MGRLATNLDQEFQARRTARGSEITRLEKGRYSTAFLFAMSLCSCALAGCLLIFVIGR
jgi:uncharacterized protein (DUF2249 family)